ncbi:hypothetical protein [Hymenobacter baengnokdamensis]|uniref:hypothetical protein n=1 Tax=Hymenobacter baengnokdamensis TaxID=2615203 RepID=UPI0012446100|nr:hypothetical protein [Hymenobacter baengnokdamensis]
MNRLLRLALLVLAALFAHPAGAQDLLTRTDGTEIQVKVVEITPDLVKYRRTDNPDGPLISVRKTEVFRIRYANGTQELGSPPAPAYLPPNPASGYPTAVPGDEQTAEPVHLSGPRLGFTVLTDGVLSHARDQVGSLSPFLTQFGWQFESRLFRLPNGTSGLVEFVPLVGGLEQGLFIPSVSGILGLRGPKGFEFGLGPNLTPMGADIVLALGTSFHSNGINFPVNLAVVPGHSGARISLLFGFNSRRN